jgi:hypothetical protein
MGDTFVFHPFLRGQPFGRKRPNFRLSPRVAQRATQRAKGGSTSSFKVLSLFRQGIRNNSALEIAESHKRCSQATFLMNDISLRNAWALRRIWCMLSFFLQTKGAECLTSLDNQMEAKRERGFFLNVSPAKFLKRCFGTDGV